MEACGVKEGTAVITTPYTFVSTAACARHLNADVYFADIEKDSYNIDPAKIEEILKKDFESREHKIKAIVPVHIAGNVCKMEQILELAKKYSTESNKIYVIEDAAHSYPSETDLGYAGTIGDVGVFSFYVTKTMTTAEGGMVCTRNEDLAKRITVMRMHGMDRTTWDRYTSPRASWEYDIIAPGYKFNLPDVLSALGVSQVKRAKLFFEQRKNMQALAQHGLTIADAKNEILGLMVADYYKGPKQDFDQNRPGDIWEFKKDVDGSCFYIKVKITQENGEDILKCMGFHEDDFA